MGRLLFRRRRVKARAAPDAGALAWCPPASGRQDAGVALELRLCNRNEAERVMSKRRGPADPPWAEDYPLAGDVRAAAAYASQLPRSAGKTGSSPFGYYQILEDGVAVGGIGFHGPPRGDMVEVGYGVVPAVRGRGVASQALRLLVAVAARQPGVYRVMGRTEETNLASQAVMRSVGMRQVGRDPDFLHFQMELDRPPG
jgi:RimJ/RimL family protein N-acetyltransferase